MLNALCNERALYRVPLVLNKAFAPRTEAASMVCILYFISGYESHLLPE